MLTHSAAEIRVIKILTPHPALAGRRDDGAAKILLIIGLAAFFCFFLLPRAAGPSSFSHA